MSLYDRDLSLSSSSVDTAPDHMPCPGDFKFYTYINCDPEDMPMNYLVKIGWIVKMADFNFENRFFANVYNNVRAIFPSNI